MTSTAMLLSFISKLIVIKLIQIIDEKGKKKESFTYYTCNGIKVLQ